MQSYVVLYLPLHIIYSFTLYISYIIHWLIYQFLHTFTTAFTDCRYTEVVLTRLELEAYSTGYCQSW